MPIDNAKTSGHLMNLVTTRNGEVPNFALLLGSGASVTSGVKTAEEMVLNWRQQLYDQFGGIADYQQWLAEQGWSESADEYSLLFEEVYDQPAQRRVFIEECVKNAHPSLGYVYLSDLLAKRYFDVVFTTNFDDLLNEACYLYSDGLRPIVAAHDSMIQSIRISSERPKIIKFHGDFLYDDIKNTLSELETLEANTKRKLTQFAKEYGLIVLGYSGRDRSVMDNIELLLRDGENFPYGIYWCVRGNPDPSKRLQSLLARDKVYQVRIDGFDEFLAELHSAAGLAPPRAIARPLEMARDRARIFVNTQSPLRSHRVIGAHLRRLEENTEVVEVELPLAAKAAIFSSQGDLEHAIPLWEQVYKEDPTDAAALYAYANSLADAGEYDRLSDLVTDSDMGAYNQTYFLLRAGKDEKVIEVARDFLTGPLAMDRSALGEISIVMVNQAIAQRRLGQTENLTLTLDRLEALGYDDNSRFKVAIAALRGDKSAMLNVLKERTGKIFSARELTIFPLFEQYRDDPDFKNLIECWDVDPPTISSPLPEEPDTTPPEDER